MCSDCSVMLMDLLGVRAKRRICFVMDCSGSMYRFNGLDGRLNRMLETTCLIFESMEGLDRYEALLLLTSFNLFNSECMLRVKQASLRTTPCLGIPAKVLRSPSWSSASRPRIASQTLGAFSKWI